MTNRTLRPTALALVALLMGLALPSVACGDGLPDGVVAKVQGNTLTDEGFALACAQQALADLKRQRSGPRAVLEQLIEELMVVQECRTLSITVTQEDVTKLWNEWDTKLRATSGGTRTLRDEIADRSTTEREFVEQMWHILRKERIAAHPKYLGARMPANENSRLQQIGIVIATVRQHTKVEYGVATLDLIQQNQAPAKLPPGVVVRVNGEPITMTQFGQALVIRLPGNKVRDYLDTECKTGLLTAAGMKLTDEELEAEFNYLQELWPLERELQRDEVWRTVSFKDRVETQFGMTEEDVRKSRYSRGLLGLIRTMRSQVTEPEIAQEFESQKDARYGAHILVHDIQIEISQKRGLMANQGLPSIHDARKIATDLSGRLARGEPFEKVANEINAQQKPWLQAKRIRIYNTDQDRALLGQAERMRDGDVSSPFDTLAEVHVMKRIGKRPARTLEEVRPHVREMLARSKARDWIEEKLKDPTVVQIRWPLPQRR